MTFGQINALVWSEGTAPKDVYPNGIATTIAEHLNESRRLVARAAFLDDSEQGVSDETLEWADVVLWWGHERHDDVTEETGLSALVSEGSSDEHLSPPLGLILFSYRRLHSFLRANSGSTIAGPQANPSVDSGYRTGLGSSN
jgi:hypothetical protein